MADPDGVLGPWLWPDPVLAMEGTWRTNQCLEESLSVALLLKQMKINTYGTYNIHM